MNYAQLQNRLDRPVRKDTKRLDKRNTYVERRGDNIAVRLHATDILTFAPDGSVQYNSGGYQTPTTKDRMNTYGPAHVTQRRGVWTVHLNNNGHGSSVSVPYRDGLIIRANGEIENVGDHAAALAERTAVARYAREYISRLRAGTLGAPSVGDCLYCQAIVQTLDGRTSTAPEHLRSHLEEGYFVPSLLMRALANAAPVERWAVGSQWAATEEERATCGRAARVQDAYIWQRLERRLRTYLLAQLGMVR